MKNEHRPIYLDHNATTPLLPEVVEAMLPYLREHFGNPSSGHLYGRRARQAVDAAREQVASLIGASPEEIVFTSGGTEANNLAILGATEKLQQKKHVITSIIEHPATAEPCRLLEQRGWTVTWLPVDRTGRIRADDVTQSVDERTALVTVMHANSETGTIQPIAETAKAAHDAGAMMHTDAAQSVGKVAVQVDALGVDLLSIAGHKLYGPKGVGALYARRGTALEPILRGANHERGLRPGTENISSIVGLGTACEIARKSLDREMLREQHLRDRFLELLLAEIPGIKLNGHAENRLPNTLNIRFPGVRGSAVLDASPDIAASTGSACHEGGESASPVLTAMGLNPDQALGAVRLSLGRATTEGDIIKAVEALARAWSVCTSP
ncbi:MAG: cysteine desulfurase [Proteobacteria bacterium]|nr:cysteine desulfurase [Pseudomonadota bacterium]